MTTSWYLRLVAVGALVLALAGCGKGAPTAGTITNKQYYPSYTWLMPSCAGYDSKGNCTVHIFIPIVEPEQWKLCLRTEDDTGRPWTGCREVDHATYDRYQIGEWYGGRQ